MSIHLNMSSTLEPLSERLNEQLKNSGADPFSPYYLVTQTEGMNTWLKTQISYSLGIAANIRFLTPNDLTSKIYQWCNASAVPSVDKDVLRWCSYAILGSADFQQKFPVIKSYYEDNQIKQIALASEVADLFDQYQIYRDDKIAEWNIPGDEENEKDWQKWMWWKLKAMIKEKFHDRVEVSRSILDWLDQPGSGDIVRQRLPKVYLFGLAVITPYYLKIFRSLARYIDIEIFILNPAPTQYWLDDRSEKQIARLMRQKGLTPKPEDHILKGNDLLLNWGSIIKESFKLLFQYDELINELDDLSRLSAGNTQRLLKKIQEDIYNNAPLENRNPITFADVKDGSITLNGCYTPLREVETLYNFLVEEVSNAESQYSAKDILVMVSDIDLYAPYIHAIFGTAPFRFNYTIADEAVTSGNSLFKAVRSLLEFDPTFFKAESVLELLESSFIRDRFHISDTDSLRTAVKNAGIIFGRSGRNEDDTRLISWEYGIKKMLYGICMGGAPVVNDGQDSFEAMDDAEGAQALERVRFIHFLQMLQHKIDERNTPRSLVGWTNYLRELMEDMVFKAGEKEDEDYPRFVQLLDNINELEELTNEPISFDVFRHSFLSKLDGEKRTQQFYGPGITFCSLVPMRSIPFQIIGMLGMNFDKFPRKESMVSFSMLSKERKAGDRNIKDNDKHLFLETLLSASKKLYISYIAKSEKDGSDLPPSVLIDECIDYVASSIGMDTDELRNKWVTIHPLHSFNSIYFKPDGLKNYLPVDHYRSPFVVGERANTEEVKVDAKVDIDRLVSFLQNPAKTYLQKKFNVFYNDNEVLLPDHESFELDSLVSWNVKNELLPVPETQLDAVVDVMSKKGSYPLANMGKALIKTAYEEIEAIREMFSVAANGNPEEEVQIDLSLGTFRLIGKVGRVFGDNFITVCNSSDRMKYLLGGWVKYLALTAVGKKLDWIYIDKNFATPENLSSGTIDPLEAQNILLNLISNFESGHNAYFYFYPALATAEMKMIENGYEEFWEVYEATLDDDYDHRFSDTYLKKGIEHGFFAEINFEALRSNVHQIMDPLMQHFPNLFK